MTIQQTAHKPARRRAVQVRGGLVAAYAARPAAFMAGSGASADQLVVKRGCGGRPCVCPTNLTGNGADRSQLLKSVKAADAVRWHLSTTGSPPENS